MVNPPRTRKRVRALPRATDGSAFQKCQRCEVFVPIALADMHKCKTKKEVKRFRGVCEKPSVLKRGSGDHQAPIVLESDDVHECETKKEVERLRGVCEKPTVLKQCSGDYQDQVRSPFRFFMESFVKMCKEGKLIDIDRRGFEAWKNMSMEEKLPYLAQAEKVDAANLRAMVEEVKNMLVVDDEADSAKAGMFDKVSTLSSRRAMRTLMA